MPNPIPPDVMLLLRFAPYFALLEGKSEEQAIAFNNTYDTQPDSIREFLLAQGTADAISAMIQSGLIPDSHGTAVSKLLGMVALGDVETDQVAELLQRLGLSQQSADEIQNRFIEILKPVVTARVAQIAAQQKMQPIAPLTQRIGAPAQPSPSGTQTSSRNIIDLRDRH